MPTDGADLPFTDIPELPADLLLRAARMRTHAKSFPGDPMGEFLEQFADELESKARQIGLEVVLLITATAQ